MAVPTLPFPAGRTPSSALLLTAFLLVLPGCAAAQVDVLRDPTFPKRKAGLWEVRTASSTANGLAPTLNCVGDRTDVKDGHLDRASGLKGSCTIGAFNRVGAAWVAESVCKEGKTNVISKAVATGDFESEYRIDTAVTYDPPLGGVKKEDKDAILARHLGPCLAHQKPGDMVIPGMGTLNMIDGTFRAEPAPARPSGRKKASDKSSRAPTNNFPEVDHGS